LILSGIHDYHIFWTITHTKILECKLKGKKGYSNLKNQIYKYLLNKLAVQDEVSSDHRIA